MATASAALSTALELTPTWWEIYRVQARILESEDKPIYTVEEAYERSIKCDDNDVNRYHYAVYLSRIHEYERALEQVGPAMSHPQALLHPLRSIKGLLLVRMGRDAVCIHEMEAVWQDRSENLPVHVMRTQGTQLADAYVRRAQQLTSLGKVPEAVTQLSDAARVVDETMQYGCDNRLVETAVAALGCLAERLSEGEVTGHPIVSLASQWDENDEFHTCAIGFRKTTAHFERNSDLQRVLPRTARAVLTFDYTKRFDGTIRSVLISKRFGFITCEALGAAHFNLGSLVDRSQWSNLRPGVSVRFGVIFPKNGSPHAIIMEVVR